MDRTRAVLLAVGLLAIGLPAGVLGLVGPAAAATGNVDVDDYGYAPGEMRIEQGDEVRWTNQGDETHTVTSDDPAADAFDSGELDSDDDFSHRFDNPGTYSYHCEIHDSMQGVVQVGPPVTTTSTSATTTTTITTTTTTSSTTTTTRPRPTTTTTRPGRTTTTTAPSATTTTAPSAPTTTVTTGRPPAAAESPAPIPAPAPPTTTRPPATTTTATVGSTTTTAGETTTTTTAASEPGVPLGPAVPERPPPQEEDGEGDLAGQGASSPLSSRGSDGGVNAGFILLVVALLAAGAFGGWTLWKLRPGSS